MKNETEARKLEVREVSDKLFEVATEGLVVVDKEGVIHLTNPGLDKMFGYSREEILGKKVEILIPDIYREKHAEYRKEYIVNPVKRPMGHHLELSGKRKDGSIFPLEVALNFFTIEKELMIMAIVSETTVQKKMINQLKKEKETAQMYLDIAGTMFVLIGQNHCVELINQKGCEILGYNEEEIIGKNWFEHFIPRKRKKEIEKVFEGVMLGKEQKFAQYESSILTKKREERLIAWNNIAIRDEQGRTIGTLSSGEDITEQKESERELLKLNAKLEERVEKRTQALDNNQRLYKMIARNFPNGVINVLDKNLNYVFVEGMEMYKRGITGDMLVGTGFLNRIDPDIRDNIRKQLLNVFKGDKASFELKTGGKTYMINAVGLPDPEGKINRVLMVSQNISDLKEAEENIQRALEKERHLNELKSRFVSMASHEFRTPLTAIMNSISLLSKYTGIQGNEEKQQKHICRIKTAIHHLTNILNDFLSLDKLEEGKVEIHYSEFDVADFSRKTAEDMEDITKEGQQINYSHRGEILVYLDKQMLKTILNNLLSNAIKYSPEDSLIEFETKTGEKDLAIVIKDGGIGIPLEEQHHLFERFFRARNALNIQGTGLGLNIVKKYMEMAGGTIHFTSEPGKGTVFTLKLPVNGSQGLTKR